MIFLCTPANPTGAMMRESGSLKDPRLLQRAGIVAVIDECFIEFLNEEKADGCIREFLAWKEGMPENGERYFSSGHLRNIRDGGTADRLWILHGSGTYRADGRKLAAVGVSIPPRKLGWRLFRMSGSRS